MLQAQSWPTGLEGSWGGCSAYWHHSPVLLPRVTPARIGFPQLGGEHADNVDEEDEIELWGEGRRQFPGCTLAGWGLGQGFPF